MARGWHVRSQWGLDLESVWPKASKGQGIHVMILDSGVASARSVLGLPDNRVAQLDFSGKAEKRRDRTSSYHGTQVASVLVGGDEDSTIGVAPEARCSCLNVYDVGQKPRVSEVVAGLRAAVDILKPDLICCTFTLPRVSEALTTEIGRVRAAKIPILVSAGDGDESEFPEQISEVISVGASSLFDQIRPGISANTTIAAPGVGIYARIPGGHSKFTGTSAAAPVAAGVVALALAYARKKGVEPWLREELVDQLRATAKPTQPPIIQPLELLEAIDQKAKEAE